MNYTLFDQAMHHIAFLKKKFYQRIILGEKTIESRWYMNRGLPYDRIHEGDIIYLKESCKPVTAKAIVTKVEQYHNLNSLKIQKLLDDNYKALGLLESEKDDFFEQVKNKNYCIFAHLKDVELIEPFNIDKTGFANQAAWITVKNIESLLL